MNTRIFVFAEIGACGSKVGGLFCASFALRYFSGRICIYRRTLALTNNFAKNLYDFELRFCAQVKRCWRDPTWRIDNADTEANYHEPAPVLESQFGRNKRRPL